MLEDKPSPSRAGLLAELDRRLREPPPGRVQVLVGPRQVGKTTLLLELARILPYATYRAVDAPEAALSGWWEAMWREIERGASDRPAVVMLDEIQYLGHWDRLVKAKIDQLHRDKLPINLVLSGSSALLVSRGLKETMAGRFEKLHFLHWSAADLQATFGLADNEAVDYAIRRGSYPGAFALRHDLARWRAYMRDSIIEPAIGRDILMLEPVRRPALLRQLLWVCLGHAAEILSLQKLAGELHTPGALETVAHYLIVLEQAFLVAGLEKYSSRMLRRRASPPKIVVLNNGLMAAWDEVSATHPHWGSWVENACLAHAWNRGQQVHYWREEPLEIDGVFSGTWGKWAVEVKTGNFTMHDLRGVFEFCRRYPEFHPLVLCSRERSKAPIPGVHVMFWGDFLLGKVPGA